VSASDHDGQRRIRRGRLPALFHVLIVAVALGLGIAVLVLCVWLDLTGSPIWEREPPWWASVLGAVLTVAGLVVQIGAIVFFLREGRPWANRPSPLGLLSWSRQRETMRKVRRSGEVVAEELPLLRQTAQAMARQRWWIGVFAGQAAAQAGLVVMQPEDVSPARLAIGAVTVALFAVGVPLIGRDARRAEAFLRAHPAPEENPRDRTVSGI
jgi:hypothetical protein